FSTTAEDAILRYTTSALLPLRHWGTNLSRARRSWASSGALGEKMGSKRGHFGGALGALFGPSNAPQKSQPEASHQLTNSVASKITFSNFADPSRRELKVRSAP